MRYRNLAVFMLTSLGIFAYSQAKVEIKHGPTPDVDPASGAEMYRAYCAVCHGMDGKGNGPAAPALNAALPDLTLLKRNNGGTFPEFRVSNAIQGDAGIAAHGSRDMPMWGDAFRNLKRDDALVKLRVHNLTAFLASMQQK